MKITNSTITINDLRLYAYHGVLEQERRVGAWFRVTATIDYPLEDAVQSDRLEDTLDYGAVVEAIKRAMVTPSQLLEHAAGRIAENIIETDERIARLVVRLTKENPPMGANVLGGASVEIECKP